MEKRVLGKTGMAVTVLGFGGAEIGFGEAAQETVNTLLNAALDAGLNIVDTAECYKNSEELIGNAVAGRRKDFFLFTKCGHDGKSFGMPDWDPKMLAMTIDRSLQRLKTDYVDLVQLHSCTADQLKDGAVIDVLKQAKAAGKTRFIGYSGDSKDALFAINTGAFDTLQTSVNIADQECITLTLPEAQKRGMGVIAKRPIANAAWKNQGSFMGGYDKPYWERLQVLQYGFLQGSMEDAVSTALRFTLSVPGVTTAIVGTKTPGRWKENAALVAQGPLEKQQFEAIRARWQEVAKAEWVGQV